MRSLKLMLFLTHIFILAFVSSAEEYDFFYFVQQWPGSFCNSQPRGCCYPTYGKPPSDFGIHGLWPTYNDSSWPEYCVSSSPHVNHNPQVLNLIDGLRTNWPSLSCPRSDSSSFWQQEWEKHGTCSEAELSQYDYFQVSLELKNSINILQCLEYAGIRPNGGYYTLASVRAAIERCIRHTIYVKCNIYTDYLGRRYNQLYEVYICINKSGKGLIDCPVFPRPTCRRPYLLFPPF